MVGSEALVVWMTVFAIGAGMVAQIAANWLGIPSIVLLFMIGIALGPNVLGVLNPSLFGEGLEAIIELSVAIILFEGGLNLDLKKIKHQQSVIIHLITYGGFITMILAGLAAHFIIKLSWGMAFLFGSLVIVTGPTVIGPLLRKVKVRSKLKEILESEGVLMDPVGSIIAIVVLKFITHESPSLIGGILLVHYRLAVGIVVGTAGGFLIGKLAKKGSIFMGEVRDIVILSSALGVYTISESIIGLSGLMAVVAAGAVVGNMHIPGEQSLRRFKGNMSILTISLLFILLAANLDTGFVISLGWRGLAVVAVLLFLVRPVQIFLTTFGSNLENKEKIFLSCICPRGIVAASVSSLFAIHLRNKGFEGGDVIQGLVFLTIGVSVVLQGIIANPLARFLGVSAEINKVVIAGANSLGIILGRLLSRNGREVAFIDSNERLVHNAQSLGFKATQGNCLDIHHLEEVGTGEASAFISATHSDEVNLLVSQFVRENFGLKAVLPVLSDIEDGAMRKVVEGMELQYAFGSLFDVDKVSLKIRQGRYKLIECKNLGDKIPGKRLGEINWSSDIIPLVLIRDGTPLVCGSRLTVGKSDRIILLLLESDLIGIRELGVEDFSEITVMA